MSQGVEAVKQAEMLENKKVVPLEARAVSQVNRE
jgi:hypothetical protein